MNRDHLTPPNVPSAYKVWMKKVVLVVILSDCMFISGHKGIICRGAPPGDVPEPPLWGPPSGREFCEVCSSACRHSCRFAYCCVLSAKAGNFCWTRAAKAQLSKALWRVSRGLKCCPPRKGCSQVSALQKTSSKEAREEILPSFPLALLVLRL